MPPKLDFGTDEAAKPAKVTDLPLKPAKRPPIDASLARIAAQQGRSAGFVRREATTSGEPDKPDEPASHKPAACAPETADPAPPMRKRPGRPSREPQTRVSLSGPVRVIERFQHYCLENGDITYWQGLEQLLDAQMASATTPVTTPAQK